MFFQDYFEQTFTLGCENTTNKQLIVQVCIFWRAGGLHVDLPHLPEGWLLHSVEGKLRHHGAGHPLRRHSVLLPRTVQAPAGNLQWFSGQVSVTWGQCTWFWAEFNFAQL